MTWLFEIFQDVIILFITLEPNVAPSRRKNQNKKLSYTAQKQRVSCACLPRLANWSCNAQNTAESQRLHVLFLTFKRSDSRSAGRKCTLLWNSHSRSFEVIHFAIICRSTRGSISSAAASDF